MNEWIKLLKEGLRKGLNHEKRNGTRNCDDDTNYGNMLANESKLCRRKSN